MIFIHILMFLNFIFFLIFLDSYFKFSCWLHGTPYTILGPFFLPVGLSRPWWYNYSSNSFYPMTWCKKSSLPSHHGGQNAFQATQQPTWILLNMMYSQKAHGAPNMTILFSGPSLHSSTTWEEILLCHLSQPQNPVPLSCRPTSLSLFPQHIFPISTGPNLSALWFSIEEL